MKGANTRNFEADILTDEPDLVRQAMQQFDEVWMGVHCKRCLRRKYCGDPIAQLGRKKRAFFTHYKHT